MGSFHLQTRLYARRKYLVIPSNFRVEILATKCLKINWPCLIPNVTIIYVEYKATYRMEDIEKVNLSLNLS